jgi:hypothetical protein
VSPASAGTATTTASVSVSLILAGSQVADAGGAFVPTCGSKPVGFLDSFSLKKVKF